MRKLKELSNAINNLQGRDLMKGVFVCGVAGFIVGGIISNKVITPICERKNNHKKWTKEMYRESIAVGKAAREERETE